MKRVFLLLIVSTILSSCYKSTLYNTNHPTMGKVVLNVEEIAYPGGAMPSGGEYVAYIDGQQVDVVDGVVEFPDTIKPGEHTLFVYYAPEAFDVERVLVDGKMQVLAKVKSTDGVVENAPEYLFFGTKTITIVADAVINESIELAQVVRDLEFELELNGDAIERVSSVKAQLSGVAQCWECMSDTPAGDEASAKPELVQGGAVAVSVATRAVDGNNYLRGKISILGLSDDAEQQLTITIGYDDDLPGSHDVVVSDVSTLLSTFNDKKDKPYRLVGDVATPTVAGVGGTIIDWTDKDEQTGTAN